jgi:hypothetical protein
MAAKLKKRALAEFQSQVLTEDQVHSGETKILTYS